MIDDEEVLDDSNDSEYREVDEITIEDEYLGKTFTYRVGDKVQMKDDFRRMDLPWYEDDYMVIRSIIYVDYTDTYYALFRGYSNYECEDGWSFAEIEPYETPVYTLPEELFEL